MREFFTDALTLVGNLLVLAAFTYGVVLLLEKPPTV